MINNPTIILVKPQLPENIGMVARAMLNFNFNSLYIVKPREENFIKESEAASAGAINILNKIKIFNDVKDAVSEFNIVYATSARKRFLNKPNFSLPFIFKETSKIYTKNTKIAILFGAEKSGLSNNDLSYSNFIINIPTNINFSSLNLAQAVILVCYQWQILNNDLIKNTELKQEILASFEELEFFFNYLKLNLENKNFFSSKERKNITLHNIKNIFLRNNLTKSEVKSLIGIVKMLSGNSNKN